jgi:tRNA pseudouridine38-40 synthase
MRYKLLIAYDGTCYAGWQVQKTGISIQSLIQRSLETVLRHPIALTGSGRTDAGVHALGQTAHFDTELSLTRRHLLSFNALLPPDIRILQVEPVASNFHARYTASGKIYHYHLHLDPILDPFTRLYRHHVLNPCDLDLVSQAIPFFLGTHNFSSFANHADRGSAAKDPVRTLQGLRIVAQKGGVRLEFEADGFLYKMVRNIAGTLLAVGAGKIAPSSIPALFEAHDRRQAAMAAPAQGLFLVTVKYENSKGSRQKSGSGALDL